MDEPKLSKGAWGNGSPCTRRYQQINAQWPAGEEKRGPDGLLRGPFMLGKALSLVVVGYWWLAGGGYL